MTTVGVLGASGFVGTRVVEALERRGARVLAVRAPRLSTNARDLPGLLTELGRPAVRRERLRLEAALSACGAVVNAAGLATATGSGDDLFGAAALLPGVVAGASPVEARFVHVSSAAVQGRASILDETLVRRPFSPYSEAKALGEHVAMAVNGRTVCFRPTSVQGPGRPVTGGLVRLLASPLASVAGRGERPTPQVLVQNVGDACAFLTLSDERPPGVVLSPSEGLTTGELARRLGGREPRHVPEALARATVALGHQLGRGSARGAASARRLEMLWFGQPQDAGWLDGRWSPPFGDETWKELT